MVDGQLPDKNAQPAWVGDEQLHLLSLSGTLGSPSITGVTLFHTIGRGSEARARMAADHVKAAVAPVVVDGNSRCKAEFAALDWPH